VGNMRASNGGERRSYYDFRMTLVMVTLVPAKMRVGSAFGDSHPVVARMVITPVNSQDLFHIRFASLSGE